MSLVVEGCEKLERLPTKFQSESLEILNFSGCRSLIKVPEVQQNVNRLSEFKKTYFRVSTSSFEHGNSLSYIDMCDCIHIETLPTSICRLKNLKFLYLIQCSKLKTLPENIGDLENIEGLDATGTTIWHTPKSFISLRETEVPIFSKNDPFALQSIQKSPTMYKELYMVSFANWKMQEMWWEIVKRKT
ncbi:hypothetical protein KY285_007681 [Solanum tuberosum]|nr:hypothetical protein KY285_007681 [Solanum tuberosum]